MLALSPYVAWLAAATSLVMLAILCTADDLRGRAGPFALGWFVIAGSCQIAGDTPMVVALGLVLQTLLAIGLIVRWRLGV